MAGGRWAGGIGIYLIQLIRKYERAVEVDFHTYYPHIDYRDRYRKEGGDSRLTLRLLILLVEELPKDRSRFWCAVQGIEPVSNIEALLMDLFAAFSGEIHPWQKNQQKRAELAKLREQAQQLQQAERERQRRLKQLDA